MPRYLLIASALMLALGAPALRAQDAPTVYRPGDGVTLPVVVTSVGPSYTSAAMERHLEGTVEIECVVRADGSVSDVKVTKSLDSVYGLDAQAVDATKQWTFKPGTKDGMPVAVRVYINHTFTLK